MKILICLDYSSVSEKILEFSRTFAGALKNPEITVLHIVDETLFFSTTGVEVELGEIIEKENNELKDMCVEYLGKNIKYIKEYGIPKLVMGDVLEQINYDMLLIGSYARHGLAGRLMGSFAEHALSISKKPVLFIP